MKGRSAPEQFVHLHNHTEFSLLDGASRIRAMVARAAELGMPALALTDHGVMYGAIQFYKECVAAGIKPIIGFEAYVAPRRLDLKEGRADRDPYHLTLLAADDQGYRNLMRLCSTGHLEGYYYRPRIDREVLSAHSRGVIVLSGCLGGELATRLRQDDLEGAREVVATYRDIFGPERYLLELQRHGVEGQEKVNQGVLRLASEFGLRVVATNDLHYVHEHEHEAHDVLLCLQTGNKFNDPNRWRFESQEFYLKTAAEMAATFPDLPEALAASLEVADQVNLRLELGRSVLPPFQVPDGLTPDDYLRRVALAGLDWRFQGNPSPAHRERLEEELAVIRDTGYSSYFLIVWDFYRYAREEGVVTGPGRGSAAGALVAYCLGITNLDPLAHGLIFERFLNRDRVSMPDIDCDFSVEGREKVIRYVSHKYGADRVAQIITFATMASKAAIRDVGRVLDVPLRECDLLAKMVPVHQGRSKSLDDALAEVPEFKDKYESGPEFRRLIDVARALEGVSRHVGVHAAGVVIAPEPLVNHVPLQMDPDREGVITQYDMKAVGDIGLLKMDFLGLANLDIIATCLRLVEARRGEKIDIDRIPLEDSRTFDLLSAADTLGVFQLEGSGMRRMLQDMKPRRFEDIVAAIALYRPGPMVNIPAYIRRKHGLEPIEYLHERLEPILNETYGVMIYQEQVMLAARELCSFTMSEADILRAAMGKKDKAKMAIQREKFIAGAVRNGIEHSLASQLFEQIAKFAEYGFNKSHSCAYAVISYQTAYLKANYPLEYLTSLMIHRQGDIEGVAAVIADCRGRGIEVLGPDVNRSQSEFSIEEERIRFGLAAIKGVGERAVELIVHERDQAGPFGSAAEFCRRVGSHPLVNRRVLEALIRSGACDSIGERASMLHNLDLYLESAERARRDALSGQTSLFGLDQAEPVPGLEPVIGSDVPPMSRDDKRQLEKELLGLYLTDHPLNELAPRLRLLVDTRAAEVTSEIAGREVRVGGVIRSIRRVVTKSGHIMAFLQLEDLTGSIEVTVFSRIWTAYAPLLKEDAVVVIQGRVDQRAGGGPVRGGQSPEAVEVEAADRAALLAEEIWAWDDPACAEIRRQRQLLVRLDTRQAEAIDDLVRLLSAHPGEDEVLLKIEVGGHEVTLQAGERHRVEASSELAAEIDRRFGARVATVEVRRPKSSPDRRYGQNGGGNGNGNGKPRGPARG